MAVGRAGAVAAARQRHGQARTSQAGRTHQHRHAHHAMRAAFRNEISVDSVVAPLGFEPLAPVAVPAFLQAFGYEAQDASTWCKSPNAAARSIAPTLPSLNVEVDGHEEFDGHTWYSVSCKLRDASESETTWKSRRRLSSLREDLHDRVKDHLGTDYAEHFAKTPFAVKGGLPGTTARLGAWFHTLAELVNRGKTSPSVVALLLQYLETPMPLPEPKLGAPAAKKPAGEGGPAGKQDPPPRTEERSPACKENDPPKAVSPPSGQMVQGSLSKAESPPTGKTVDAFLQSNDIEISLVS